MKKLTRREKLARLEARLRKARIPQWAEWAVSKGCGVTLSDGRRIGPHHVEVYRRLLAMRGNMREGDENRNA